MRWTPAVFSKSLPQRGLHAGSILIGFAALALLAAAFSAQLFSRHSSSVLLPLVLIALVAAITLHVRFLLLVRRQHHETAIALDATELEYKSVFDTALDGIVVFDNYGVCVEANLAAHTLFGKNSTGLAGTPIDKLFAGAANFRSTWRDLVDGKCVHDEMQIARADGTTLFVEYTARANYLLGRHVAVLRDVTKKKRAEAALRESEQRFQQMAGNIHEIFWMLDAESKKVIYVNKAYEIITGCSCESLRNDPRSYQEIVHPEDRVWVLSRLDDSMRAGEFDGEFRIITPNGAVRWVWVRGLPITDEAGTVRRLVGSAQDVTARKSAEEQTARNLALAESAWAEAEAFRKISLALTQNLSMDDVLDTLLESLLKLIPCESAQILLVESGTRLFLAREVRNCNSDLHIPETPATFDARSSRSLMQGLATQHGVLIPDTTEEPQWAGLEGFSHLHSWVCVPLVASQQVLGFLSLGDTHPQALNREHLRLAESLAIPAAVAIQNARLYEQAEMFRAEIEQRLADVYQTEKAMPQLRGHKEL